MNTNQQYDTIIQSPKQPQALILPVNKTKAVRKVKNKVSNNNNQLVIFFFQPISRAKPNITSNVIMNTENKSECAYNHIITPFINPSLAHTSKNSCILYDSPNGSMALTRPEKMNKAPTNNRAMFTVSFIYKSNLN